MIYQEDITVLNFYVLNKIINTILIIIQIKRYIK